jgi:hypothetical protein
VLYALTGVLPELQSLKDFNIEKFQQIRQKLSDQVYEAKDTFITVFQYNANRSVSDNDEQSVISQKLPQERSPQLQQSEEEPE